MIKEHIVRIASAVVKYVLFFNALLSASQFSDVSLKLLELSSIPVLLVRCLWAIQNGNARQENRHGDLILLFGFS